MKKAWIYKIENTKNKNCYVGSTTNFSRRKKDHLRILKENRHHCKYLQRAWNKYGEGLFTFEIVESFNYLTKDSIKIFEYLIISRVSLERLKNLSSSQEKIYFFSLKTY